MTVLVGCECSQRVAIAFRNAGHDAYSCDIQPSYGGAPGIHLQGDLREIYDKVKPDLFIAHPPCTYLSRVQQIRLFPHGVPNEERLLKMREAAEFFNWCLSRPARFVCVENPVPVRAAHLPPPSQAIEPYMFGDPYTKHTFLWLRNLPELMPTYYVKPLRSWTKVRRDAKRRSETFRGIAEAMAAQWGGDIMENYQYTMGVF